MKIFLKNVWKIILLCGFGLYLTSLNPEKYGYMGTISVLVLVFLMVRLLKTHNK
tara:strand:+ start:89 stop:250 length:162 start_codon:yes stop_codon:yes gene_type:complete